MWLTFEIRVIILCLLPWIFIKCSLLLYILIRNYLRMAEQNLSFTEMTTKRKVVSTFLNVISIGTATTVIGLIQLGYLNHHRSGYYCNDPELSFKYQGDTVRPGHLLLGCLLIPLITMIIFEFARAYFDRCTSFAEYSKCVKKIVKKWYGGFLVAILLNVFLIEVFKFTFGRPRPHFFDTCRPNVNCTTGFVSKYECSNEMVPHSLMLDSYRSFLSGHASLSVFVGLFTFWYIEKRGSGWCPRLMGVVLQLSALGFSIYSSITRITDHRHHWWDVLCGAILGMLITIYAVLKYCDNFQLRNQSILPESEMHRDIESVTIENKNYRLN